MRAAPILTFWLLLPAGVTLAGGAPAPARAAGVHAALGFSESDPGRGMVLGGWADGKWMAQEALAARLKGGATYHLYSLTKSLGEFKGGKPVEGEPLPEQKFVPVARAPKGRLLVGVGGKWNALPRPPRSESTRLPVYRDAAAALLRSKGLSRPVVRLTQVLRADLDGDGKDEVLISATNPGADPSRARRNDYTLVMLRTLVKGKVRTLLLDGTFFPKAGGDMSGGHRLSVIGVPDLNGDGTQEIVVRYIGYEEDGYDVYELRSGAVKKILTAGIGS